MNSKNKWLRFGCFLTGYNFEIIQNSSEISAKSVSRYTSAIIIICIIWAFVGYSFTQRYLHLDTIGAIIGSGIFVIIVIQIERQIILSIKPGKWLYLSRGIIAVMMAIIGSLIIDQIIFKDDIELEKVSFMEERIKRALPPKTEELRNQIASLDAAIAKKEGERTALQEDISNRPTIVIVQTTSTTKVLRETTIDSLTGQAVLKERSVPHHEVVKSSAPNPNIGILNTITGDIEQIRIQKTEKENALLNIRATLEKDFYSKVGFLDELEVMYKIVSNSNVALLVWLLWFFLLFALELLVLVGKIYEKENDYERTVEHQMSLRVRTLDALARGHK